MEKIRRYKISGLLASLLLALGLFTVFQLKKRDTNLISLSMDVDDMELDVDTLIPLGLIINELLTNSLKYAFPAEREGSLLVSLSKSDNQIELVVKDDGVGYDPTEVRDDSFGSTLIAALTEQLEGVISFETKLDGGTSVTIVIPSKM